MKSELIHVLKKINLNWTKLCLCLVYTMVYPENTWKAFLYTVYDIVHPTFWEKKKRIQGDHKVILPLGNIFTKLFIFISYYCKLYWSGVVLISRFSECGCSDFLKDDRVPHHKNKLAWQMVQSSEIRSSINVKLPGLGL